MTHIRDVHDYVRLGTEHIALCEKEKRSALTLQLLLLPPIPLPSQAELEAFACDLPQGDACTTATSVADINVGVGSYYDPECSTGAAASGGVVGCETSE